MKKPKIQWHPGFFAGMELELKNYHLDFESEHELTRGPLYIDILIIRKLTDERIDNEIGEIFRRYNIVEYKSPDDELNIDVFYKVQAYAGFYKASGEQVNAIPADEITVSLVRASYPEEMIKKLQSLGATITQRHPGVYDIEGVGLFPTQVITTNELTAETHAALRVLTTNAKREDVERFVLSSQNAESQGDRARIDAVLQVSVSANEKLYETLKEEMNMCQALAKLMEPEIKMAEEQAEARGVKIGEARGEARGVKIGEARGEARGIKIGEAKSIETGENKLGHLISKLLSLGRTQDIERAANDPEYRKKLYTELSIA